MTRAAPLLLLLLLATSAAAQHAAAEAEEDVLSEALFAEDEGGCWREDCALSLRQLRTTAEPQRSRLPAAGHEAALEPARDSRVPPALPQRGAGAGLANGTAAAAANGGRERGKCSKWEAAVMRKLGWGSSAGLFPQRLSSCGYFGLSNIWSRLREKFRLRHAPEDDMERVSRTVGCISQQARIGELCASCFAAAADYMQERCRFSCVFFSWLRKPCQQCRRGYDSQFEACTGFSELPEVALPDDDENGSASLHVSLLQQEYSVREAAGSRSSPLRDASMKVVAFLAVLVGLVGLLATAALQPAATGGKPAADEGPALRQQARHEPPEARSAAKAVAVPRVPLLCPGRSTLPEDATTLIVPISAVRQLRSGAFPAQLLAADGRTPLLHAWLPFVGAGGDIFSFDVLGRRLDLGSSVGHAGRGFWLQLTAGPTLRRPLCSLGPLQLEGSAGGAASGAAPMEIRGPGNRRFGAFEGSGAVRRVVYEGATVLKVSAEFPFPHLSATSPSGAQVASLVRQGPQGPAGTEALVLSTTRGTDAMLSLLAMLAVALSSPEFSAGAADLRPSPLPRFGP